MKEYLSIFIDKDYPHFIDKYLNTKTMERLKHITQFCGCDYTKLYSPLFLYTRFDHSVVTAHMTWHFTHNKEQTIAALLHDAGTPCFAHCIDYVFGDYVNQESSEKRVIDLIKKDKELMMFLREDNISLESLDDFSNYHILENKTPKLCTDRLDGVLHTSFIWLHTHSLEQIKEVYDNLTVLTNEDGNPEIGFTDVKIAEKFVNMVYVYAIELQGNTDKYIMKYVSEIVKLSVERKLISLEDLYTKKEVELCNIFHDNFASWQKFNESVKLISTDEYPKGFFSISFNTKKRNTIPLVKLGNSNCRIDTCSNVAKEIYDKISKYEDKKWGYVENIRDLL